MLVPLIALSMILILIFHHSVNERLNKAFQDLWNSFRYFLNYTVTGNDNKDYVTIDKPNIDVNVPSIDLPLNPDVFVIHLQVWAKTLINKDNFDIYLNKVGMILKLVIQFLMLPGLLIVLTIYLLNKLLFYPRNGTTEDTTSYMVWGFKRANKALTPAYIKFVEFIKFYIDKYKKITIFILLYISNGLAVIISFIAWYFYFIYSFDFSSIYTQFFNTVVDLYVLFPVWSIPFWCIFFYWIFDIFRKYLAVKKLESLEAKNERAVEELGVAIGIVGPQGSGKDVLSTYFSLIFEKLFKKQLIKDMILIRSEFPDFPFRKLEIEIEDRMNNKKIVNKIQAQNYMSKKMKSERIIYDYDLDKRKRFVYDGLKIHTIEDELSDYAALYYLYTSKSIVANYQIRSDSFKEEDESDRFPNFNFDWMKRNKEDDAKSIRSSIINFNSFRILKKFELVRRAENDMLLDSGVFVVTEIDKDRGNRYSNQRRKGMDVNPENDGTKITGKLIRHLGTIRNYCYLRYIYNMQQFGGLAGDENFIAETNIYIKKQKKDFQWAIPMFWIEPVLLRWIIERSLNFIEKHIKARNDVTLRFYIVMRVTALLSSYYSRIFNTYAYKSMDLSLSSPTIKGDQEDSGDMQFYIIRKIIFANRYRTDMMAGLFKEAKLHQKIGVNQLKEYQGDIANIKELISQCGYFTTEIAEMMNDNYIKKE